MKNPTTQPSLAKVPAITAGFWAIKILATTFGETAGDTVSMSMNLGYLFATGLFATTLVALVFMQIRARRFHPPLYWATIIASTTAGTTMADFATRSLGIGYAGGSIILLALVLLALLSWRIALGSIDASSVHEPRSEIYYWVAITLSQTLGTALGDWVADGALGYLGSAAIFGTLLLIIALLHYRSRFNSVVLFWVAFILTRPLGAVVGDFLDKPIDHGGLALSRAGASLVLAAAILLLTRLLPQEPAIASAKREPVVKPIGVLAAIRTML
jgi:uncharacterized membrane-anchored protein